ncbi:MAG: AzlC family ABC transporter permease [Oscillospiraceae bacterium]
MKTIKFGIKQIIPFAFSYIFVGLAYGVLVSEAGYSPIWAVFSGLFIYAGSMQIVMIALMKSGASLFMLAIMTLFINGRHMFYGIGFIEKFRKIGGWRYPYMALTMTDETYCVLCNLKYDEGIKEEDADFCILFLSHMLLVASCLAGALIGKYLSVDMAGIDFSATAFFLVVVVNQWRQFPSHLPAVAGGLSAIIFYLLLGKDSFILPALAVSVVVLLLLKGRVEGQSEVVNR